AALFPDELVESELGLIPLGWENAALYDTADYVNGSAFKAVDFSEDGSGLPIVKIAELKQGITSQTKFTEKTFQNKYAIESGDMLYSWSGSPETSLDVFKWFGGCGWLNQHIFKLNFSSNGQRYFAFYLLKHLKPLLVQTAMDKQTTGLGHVTVADMKRIKVAYPDKKLLKAFCDSVEPFYELDSQMCQQTISLATLRDTLLLKLLSGELRPPSIPPTLQGGSNPP
ncbi:MAG: restriction endonuclease subunit S, partial [Desulfuromonas sp.]|nr:restriction endonuclease subunit S [Desulfuromonas sp.]